MLTTHGPAQADLAAGKGGARPWPHKVLVPVRWPADAFATLTVAARLSQTASAELCLLHVRVFDPPVRGTGRFYFETADDAAMLLNEALVTVWAYGVVAGTAVTTGPRADVAEKIAEFAASWQADLIVATRRPRSAFYRMVNGCTADQVMRKAPCPVLAVAPGRRGRQEGS